MVDSHFHSLSMREKGIDPREHLTHCFERGFAAALDVAVDADLFDERRALLAPFERVYLTAGISPFAAGSEGLAERLQRVERQLAEPKVVAIGEIGLDRHWNYGTPEAQRSLLTAQLEMAERSRLPVVIHNREADSELLEAIRTHRPPRGGVMHCFSSDFAAASRFIDLGFLISFAGNVTYKRSDPIQETARRIPAEAVLIETDSPYLAPVPARGRAGSPALVAYTYAFVAGLRGIEVEELVARVRANFFGLVGEA